MLKRLIPFVSFAVLLAALTVAGCGGDDDDGGNSGEETDEPFVIGAAVGESGFMSAYDGPPMKSLDLAIEDINKDDGILGRQVELITEDTRSDRAEASSAAQKLVEEGADMLVVSCDFDFGSPAAFVGQEAGLISFTLCAQSPKFGVQGIGPFAYSPNMATLAEAVIAAEWAYDEGWRRVYELKDEFFAYTKEVCEAFGPRFEELGGEIVGQDTFKNDDASVAAQISRIRSTTPQPDFIRLCTSSPGISGVVRQMRAAGIDVPLLGPMAADGDYWLDAVPNLSDFYYPAPASVFGDDPNPKTNSFVERYTKETGGRPESSYALMGYALLEAYEIAAERAGSTDAEAVAGELNQFDREQLLTGPTTYTEENHLQYDSTMHIMQIQDGEVSYLDTWEIVEPPTFDPGS